MQEKALSNGESDDYLSGSNAPIDGWVASSLRSDRKDGLGQLERSRADRVPENRP